MTDAGNTEQSTEKTRLMTDEHLIMHIC